MWFGVSAENQETADQRIPLLLRIPAAVRFVSYEPALGLVDFRHYFPGLDWVIIGGESGPGARPFEIAWARRTISLFREAGAAVFLKQFGAFPVVGPEENPSLWPERRAGKVKLKDRKGANWDEWPDDLRVREFPKARSHSD